MLYQAKNATLRHNGWEMDYICFGRGERNLILLPGLGDGLRTMKGTALPMALMYRIFAGDFKVWSFSRRTVLPEGHSIRDMARDLAEAMDALGIEKADIVGVSMGGMIAQYLAADFPEKVNKLVLVVTAARSNPILRSCVEEWVDQARRGDHTALMGSNLEKIYSEKYYRQNKWMVPLLGLLTKPKSYDRFLVQAQAVLNHNAWDRLEDISCPTLVMGGARDKCLGGEASREIAGKIPGAKLRMYEAWGHGLYEEEKAFNRHVLEFLRED